MIDTSRISSGFDIEFQLGKGWFITALNGLAEKGVLVPPGTPGLPDGADIEVSDVEITFDTPDQDLDITILIGGLFPVSVQAAISLSDDGSELILENSLSSDPTRVPFGALSGLAGSPELIKLAGDDNHEPVIAILANMDIRASSQNGAPLPAGEHLARGDSSNALSFLPNGKHITLGVANDVLQRFANDIWHNQLAGSNGGHPFPDEDNRQGDWQSVSMSVNNDRITTTLRAVAEIDTPIIDLIPDPDITITVDLIPVLEDGNLSFQIEVDSSVDFGLLGDVLAAFIGGLVGFIIGLFTGNPIGGAVTGAVIGVVVLEVGEVIVGGVIAKEIQAKIDDEPLVQFYKCKNDVVHLATIPDQGQGLNLGFLDSLPTSIPIYTDNPDPLYERVILVQNHFDQVTLNGNGFALEGDSLIQERFTPVDASLVNKTVAGDALSSLFYRTTDGVEQELTLADVLDRASEDGVPEPLNLMDSTEDDLIERKQDGKIPVACMHPTAIHREATIITEIRFTTGLELSTLDTIRLQDAGVLILPGLQLIHPSNGRPYYRAPADDSIENNFESLPEY